MTLGEFIAFLIVAVISLIYTVVFNKIFRNKGPWGSTWSFYVVLLLILWAFSMVIRFAWQEQIVTYIIVITAGGFVLSVLLCAANHPPGNGRLTSLEKTRDLSLQPTPEIKNRLIGTNICFRILLIALSIVIILTYILKNT